MAVKFFTNGKIMDVINSNIYDASIIAEDGFIKEIGPDLKCPEGAEIIDFKGDTASLFGALDGRDYHVNRWCDAGVGMCDRTQMMPHPMSVIRRGPVMLARSKRMGATEEEMFSGETVWGKERTVSVQPIRHDRFLSAVRVTVSCKLGKTYVYDMCDAASAANRDLEEVRFFTMYI